MQILHVTNENGWGGNLTLPKGHTIMLFDETELWIVEDVIKGIMDMYPKGERDHFWSKLKEIHDTVRVRHTKEELQ